MNNPEPITPASWGLVSSLAELHQWELENLPLLSTLTGRHLYYRMAEETFHPEEALTKALKDLFGGAHFTEKALRSRMREMERDGLIETITDYLNVGVTVGSTTKALALMNSALGQLSIASVNTAAGVKDLATAADNVMKVAAGTSGASVSAADLEKLPDGRFSPVGGQSASRSETGQGALAGQKRRSLSSSVCQGVQTLESAAQQPGHFNHCISGLALHTGCRVCQCG